MTNFLVLLLALVVIIKSADNAIRSAGNLALSFRISKYVVGFLVVAVISILPETFIAITSAFQGVPGFGLGTLFGSNVADLTLVFAIVTLVSAQNLKIESTILKNGFLYIGAMAIPIILGLNGVYSRSEGAVLILVGLLFYFLVLRKDGGRVSADRPPVRKKDVLILIASMALLLISSSMTVKYGVALATSLEVNPILIGLLVVGIGTTLPELAFSIRAVRSKHDGLALGDLLGTVITDATIVVGIVAMLRPFTFNARIIYITGIFMLLATIVLFTLMRSGRTLTKREAMILLAFYVAFVTAEFFANT